MIAKAKDKATRFVLVFLAAALALLIVAGCELDDPPEAHSPSDIGEVDDLGVGSRLARSTTPYYVLIVGNDTRKGTVWEGTGCHGDINTHSDVMMLMRVDPKSYKVTILSIPRDTMTEIDGEKIKINCGYDVGGIKQAIKEAESLTGAKVKYYFDMSFVQFEKFYDTFGGFEVEVPIDIEMEDIVSNDPVSISEGTQSLTGKEMLALARERHAYEVDQDAYRQVADRSIVQTTIEYVAAHPDQMDKILNNFLDNVATNMPEETLFADVEAFVNAPKGITIYSATGPYEGDIDSETELWFAWRDEDTWHKIISTTNKGKNPAKIVKFPSSGWFG